MFRLIFSPFLSFHPDILKQVGHLLRCLSETLSLHVGFLTLCKCNSSSEKEVSHPLQAITHSALRTAICIYLSTLVTSSLSIFPCPVPITSRFSEFISCCLFWLFSPFAILVFSDSSYFSKLLFPTLYTESLTRIFSVLIPILTWGSVEICNKIFKQYCKQTPDKQK